MTRYAQEQRIGDCSRSVHEECGLGQGRRWPVGECKVKQRPHELTSATSNAPIPIGQMALTPLIEAARSQWQGLVEAPNGIGGSTLGAVGITTPDFLRQDSVGTSTEDKETNRNAGSGEGHLDNQPLLTYPDTFFAEKASSHQQATSNELWLNGNATFSADRHAIDANPDTGLTAKNTSFFEGVVDEGRSKEAAVIQHGATINESAIGVTNVDVSADLSAKGSEGAVTDLHVLDVKELASVLFKPLPGFSVQENGLVAVPPCSMLHPA